MSPTCTAATWLTSSRSWKEQLKDREKGSASSGRLPVLPLTLWLLGGTRTFTVQRPVARRAVLAVLCLTSLVILQGAGLYAAWQMS